MWLPKKEWRYQQQRFRELQEDYWIMSSDLIDLRIDNENLQRKIEQLQQHSSPQLKAKI
jgi:hypothetical protein